MGTITQRKRKNGTTAHVAQIVITRDYKPIHRENKTFDRQQAARAWIKKREKELNEPGGLQNAQPGKAATLEDAIKQYEKDSKHKMGRTKAQCLATILQYDIAKMACDRIGSPELLAFAKEIAQAQNLQPQTVQSYLSHLGAVFAIAKPAWNMPLDPAAMKDTFAITKRLGITGKGKPRDRRPTLEELDLLLTHFEKQKRYYPDMMPMHVLTGFAMFSTRRQEEITRLAKKDFDEDGKRILVRDMKHPGQKTGNDIWCDLPDPAFRILTSNQSAGDIFLPFNNRTVSANFTRACQFLNIDDLHFHDLRHEGISRLFEMGNSIPHVAAVSGHRSWQSLQRYTHIRQVGDKYDGWKWIDRLCHI